MVNFTLRLYLVADQENFGVNPKKITVVQNRQIIIIHYLLVHYVYLVYAICYDLNGSNTQAKLDHAMTNFVFLRQDLLYRIVF